MRRKGELSPAGIDRGWPHQVALPARFCERGGYQEIHEFCKELTLCTPGTPSFMTPSGFTSTASPNLKTPINSSTGSVVRILIRNNEGRVATGRVGKSPRLPTYRQWKCRKTKRIKI